MSITQGEAVFQAVSMVVGEINGAVSLTDAQKQEVHKYVFEFFQNGTTVHSGNPTDAQLNKYIPGLVNNWVRKDPRLNGGVKYQTKRPGSRSGSGDEAVREMRKLLATQTDPAVKEQIQAAIDARLEELKPKTVIDSTKLPENLRHLAK